MTATIEQILEFWFGAEAIADPSQMQERKAWFHKNSAFDQTIRDCFLPTYQAAAAGELDHWQSSPTGCLGLLIVLDQFSRNMFRHSPQAFATDEQARAIAKWAIAQGWDRTLHPIQRIFFYLPLEHSEQLSDQHQSIACYRALVAEQPSLSNTVEYALQHLKVIEQFGRFPHRNAILGRESTPAELAFLQQPGSSF